MVRKKYFTEEEKKAARREYNKRYCQKHKDEITAYKAAHKAERAEYMAKYYQDNKEKIDSQNAEWRKNNPTYRTEYYQANKEVEKDKAIKRYYANKDAILEQKLNKRSTPLGRASVLINNYIKHDRKQNRDECTLTPEWIVDNIFSKPCHYCGETDWTKIGCDRIDNSKPHTPDNVVPCCDKCNCKRGRKDYEEFIKEMGMT